MMGADALSARYSHRVGEMVGDLRFIGIFERRGDNGRVLGEFRCSCGGLLVAALGRTLNKQERTHCGCKTDRGKHRTHGMRYSPEYSSWQAMKGRCLDPDNKDFPRWGGIGVTVCQEWIDSFEAFYEHIGPRPPETSLDRKDTRLGYVPGNVRWATPTEQARNRRGAFRWFIKGQWFESHGEAASHFGVSEHTIWRWVNGQEDRRRNSFTLPRSDCHVVSRY